MGLTTVFILKFALFCSEAATCLYSQEFYGDNAEKHCEDMLDYVKRQPLYISKSGSCVPIEYKQSTRGIQI